MKKFVVGQFPGWACDDCGGWVTMGEIHTCLNDIPYTGASIINEEYCFLCGRTHSFTTAGCKVNMPGRSLHGAVPETILGKEIEK